MEIGLKIDTFLKIDDNNLMKFTYEENTIRDVYYYTKDITAFNSFLRHIINIVIEKELYLMEIWIPASETDYQKSCLLMGLLPLGYFPVSLVNTKGEWEDAILFVFSQNWLINFKISEMVPLIRDLITVFVLIKNQSEKINVK